MERPRNAVNGPENRRYATHSRIYYVCIGFVQGGCIKCAYSKSFVSQSFVHYHEDNGAEKAFQEKPINTYPSPNNVPYSLQALSLKA